MTATTAADDKVLIGKINEAVQAHNKALEAYKPYYAELESKAREVGKLLLEAQERHPDDFDDFLKKHVRGLGRSRAYECMAIASGRKAYAEQKQDTRKRVQKHREKRKALSKPEPAPETDTPQSVTDGHVTDGRDTASPEVSIEQRQAEMAALDDSAEKGAEKPQDEYQDWLDAGDREFKVSAQALAEFTVACRTWLPKMTQQVHRDQARRLVIKMTGPLKAEAA